MKVTRNDFLPHNVNILVREQRHRERSNSLRLRVPEGCTDLGEEGKSTGHITALQVGVLDKGIAKLT